MATMKASSLKLYQDKGGVVSCQLCRCTSMC